MKPFIVVALGSFLKENSVDTVFASFSEFYHSISHKYQKKARLIVIDKQFYIKHNNELAIQYKVADQTTLLSLQNQEEIEKNYEESTLLVLPRLINSSSIIKEAFLYGLPVIGYANYSHDNLLEASSGIRIYYESQSQAVEKIAESLRMLNYDPEAVKMLKSGALNRYNSENSLRQERSRG